MTNDTIDAVGMTRQIRDRMYDESKHLKGDELVRFIRERSQEASRKVREREVRTEPSPVIVE